jgi:hypothetical protein
MKKMKGDGGGRKPLWKLRDIENKPVVALGIRTDVQGKNGPFDIGVFSNSTLGFIEPDGNGGTHVPQTIEVSLNHGTVVQRDLRANFKESPGETYGIIVSKRVGNKGVGYWTWTNATPEQLRAAGYDGSPDEEPI